VTPGALPVISGVAASNASYVGATVSWTTSVPSDSQIDYGRTTAYGSSTLANPSLLTSHSQVLSGLTAGTVYHYRVKSRDGSGSLATSADGTFTTVAVSQSDPARRKKKTDWFDEITKFVGRLF
jgi:phosphodiesterase/alkaline phosphatase D-like protein